MTVADVTGVKIAGLIFDAGPVNSPALLEVGTPARRTTSDPADPTTLQDVFFRIGGATAGKATTSLVVNSDNVSSTTSGPGGPTTATASAGRSTPPTPA